MCMFGGQNTPKVQQPVEYAQQKAPDGGAVRTNTGRRTEDRLRAGSNTILTGGSGVTTTAPTEKKTLLGQ